MSAATFLFADIAGFTTLTCAGEFAQNPERFVAP
jgi:class 3 adenylate cyclase